MRALGRDGTARIHDRITVQPTITSTSNRDGRAWLADLDAGRRQQGIRTEDDATLVHWIIEAPWAHPCWHSYSLFLLHLRKRADGREFYIQDATHELWLYALNPDHDRNDLIVTGLVEMGDWLTPANFAVQFTEISDELARERVRRAVQDVCDGKLNPDADFRWQWAALFGDNMRKDRPHPEASRER
jgi:hypothetical protein